MMNKICNRCKVNKERSKNFKKEIRERLSGVYTWWHPWCYECRNKVKELWSVFGKPTGECREKITFRVPSTIKRTSNKTSNIKRSGRTIPNSKVTRHKISGGQQKRRSRSTRSGGVGIVATLKKKRDYKNV